MKTRLLEYLVCPACRGELEFSQSAAEGDEIMEGQLICRACGVAYPIRRGVPRMLSRELPDDKRATADAFGYEWTHFTEMTEQYEAQFLDWIDPVEKSFFAGKVVLDAGCGKGRHLYLAARFGASDAIGIDLSQAVEVAYRHTRSLPNAHVVQADIYHLPFRQPFDYAYSIGVLHHLPDPRAGFLSLVKHLKPGGRISAWVYGRENNDWIVYLVNPIRTLVTARLPKIITKALSFLIALPMQLVLKLVYRPINHRLPALKRFLFYNDYLYSICGFSFRENFSIVFDHLVAPTAFYLTRQEFSEWFSSGGLRNIQISWRNRNSWRGTGEKE